MVPVRLSWLVISVVILSARTFWIAGSWISGSTVATHRPVSETSLPAQTPSTATGASMQPRTMSTRATGVRQLIRRRRGGFPYFPADCAAPLPPRGDVPPQLALPGWARRRPQVLDHCGCQAIRTPPANSCARGHLIVPLGQRLILRKLTLAPPPPRGAHPSGVNHEGNAREGIHPGRHRKPVSRPRSTASGRLDTLNFR